MGRELELKQDFRHAMRRLAATVSVITCADEDGWHGMTATAVTSLCAEPPAVLVCVNRSASMRASLMAGRRFCVNLLGREHAALSQDFGGARSGAERFGRGKWSLSDDGMPYLADAQANVFCTIDQVVPYGTHEIVIGRVERVRAADEVQPLIYQNGGYAVTTALESLAAD